LAVDVLRRFFDGGIDGEEGFFGEEELFDAGAELRPEVFGVVEVRAEVENGALG
jgi:hypothetical protein